MKTDGADWRAGIRLIWTHGKIYRILIMSTLSLASCSQVRAIEYLRFDGLLDNLGPSRDILRVIAVVAGITLLFAGWRIYRFVVILPGLLVGAGCGAVVGYQVLEMWQAAVVGLLAGGLTGALLSIVLHDLAVFVIGAIGAVYVMNDLWSLFFNIPPSRVLLFILGIIGGVVLLAMSKHRMILLSSIVGATMLAWGIPTSIWLMFGFFSLGLIVQYSLSKATEREPSSKFP